ncbi:hypothetical protein AVEN_96500-1 [Araneus ventricosus]|uniref:Uncharacterized protein n=1 Tax=Araneus ventricosus TaxID=182803 RepID=A0A4Y2CVY7_ARAVE|nr:hypothetical protein AVEN_96500-1 [Araneus ventricosus]
MNARNPLFQAFALQLFSGSEIRWIGGLPMTYWACSKYRREILTSPRFLTVVLEAEDPRASSQVSHQHLLSDVEACCIDLRPAERRCQPTEQTNHSADGLDGKPGLNGRAPNFPLELSQQFLRFASSMGIVMQEDDAITQHARESDGITMAQGLFPFSEIESHLSGTISVSSILVRFSSASDVKTAA